MKYLFPSDNLLTVASGYTPFPGSINTRTGATKAGGGMVSLTGGAIEDATYDVEIVNNTIVGTPTVSMPTFAGVGNPVMSSVAAIAGTSAQSFAVTLTDLGMDTTYAFVPFQGVNLRAKSSGSGGNSITINVNESGITRTGTDYALFEPLTKDANEYVGDQWNFGASVLNADGTIPSAAPRVSFGADPQVYRQYKEFRDGRYVYRFSPAPVRDVQEGARVYAVTGSRVVTTDNTVTTRTYTGVTSLYSLLNAIIGDASAHVDVDGAVTNDTHPNGMAMVEMSVRTVSYVQSIERDGTIFVRNANLDVSATDDAPTELLTITCKTADYIGAETWEVRGTVSGELADAVTDVLYDGADYDFTIPLLLPPSSTPAAEQKSARLELITRTDGAPLPVLCLENFVLGADARNRTFTYTWRTRATECNCDNVDVDGGPDDDILGIDPGTTMSEEIPAALQTPLQTLYNWRKTFVGSNAALVAPGTAVTGDSTGLPTGTLASDWEQDTITTADHMRLMERVSAVLKVDRVDIDAANQATAIFHSALRNIYDTLGTVPAPAQAEWDAAETQLETDFSTLLTNTGADWWRTWSAYIDASSFTTPNTAEPHQTAYAARLLMQDFDAYLERYRAWMDKVLVLAGVEPDFDSATRRGNNVWQDEGGNAWFESEDGLLPIQPGFYYHSCRLGEDDEPVSTQEFGIGVGIGCLEALAVGDKLIITISPIGNLRVTYQVGDQFRVKIIAGAPAQLGGGQTGTDTQTWRVVGSVAGALADYSLYKPTPNTYSASGLTFLITPGGIDSALGDEFEFFIEGGQFRYRKNGGAWSANTQIAASVNIDTAGGAAVAAAFATGAAPSFVIGDTYNFSVQALHTLERLCSPVDGAYLNGDSTGGSVSSITYTATMLAASQRTILFARSAATAAVGLTVSIHNGGGGLLFSNDYQINPGDNAIDLTADIDGYGTGATLRFALYDVGYPVPVLPPMTMLWLGHPLELDMPNGVPDPGIARTRVAIGNKARPRVRYGANVQHVAVASSSVDDLIERLNDAAVNHQGRFAAVWPAGSQTECGIVRFTGEDLEVEDEFDYQPTDSTDRLLRFTLPLEAVA